MTSTFTASICIDGHELHMTEAYGLDRVSKDARHYDTAAEARTAIEEALEADGNGHLADRVAIIEYNDDEDRDAIEEEEYRRSLIMWRSF